MYELPLPTLPFTLVFGLGIALFHTIIFQGLFQWKYKPTWLMFVIDPLIIVGAYLLFPQINGIILLGLAGSVFLCGIIGMFIQGVKAGIDSIKEAKKAHLKWWKVVGGLLLIIAFFASFLYLGIYALIFIIFFILLKQLLPNDKNKFYLLQRTLATSKANSLAIGMVEVVGTASTETPVISTRSETSCVGFIYTVDKVETKTDSDGHTSTSYTEVKRITNIPNFFIEDETGKVEIHADKLQWIDYPITNEDNTGHYRYREYILDTKTDILLVGQASSENGVPFIQQGDSNNTFGMSTLEQVTFSNTWRPLKLRFLTMITSLAVCVALVFLTPMRIENNKLIIEKNTWVEQWKLKKLIPYLNE